MHNKVDDILTVASHIKEEIPDAVVSVAHGQMDKEELSEIWYDMTEGKIDVLVCTTIIETGVDVPNANTLIIEDADRMGLSQLHQIRGRVGRSTRRAYAYLTYDGTKALSERYCCCAAAEGIPERLIWRRWVLCAAVRDWYI